ncbi:hypothetical protein [Mycobacteroides abscessus]|uniref:hypothetical protein n=1 Tax=Mycobacteroides abscessus TaxID=36809 RepID=UPI0005DC3196|nr:hypothetical protein [Mycobacteroides abscessus]CPW95165.1 Uncharacterised protein [Mycobacteroides abscessus]
MTVFATRVDGGVLVSGVRRYLGYTDRNFLTDEDAAVLVSWLRRDGDEEGAVAVERALGL